MNYDNRVDSKGAVDQKSPQRLFFLEKIGCKQAKINLANIDLINYKRSNKL